MGFEVEHLIAKRAFRHSQKGFLRWIVLIAQIAVGLSLAVMILTVSTVQGFQKEIANKVFGFWGHISIAHAAQDRSLFSISIKKDSNLLHQIRSINQLYVRNDGQFNWFSDTKEQGALQTAGGVEAAYPVALLPGIITSGENFDGIILKGLDREYPVAFLENYLKKGKLPDWYGESPTRDILLSEQTANRLVLDVGDKMIVYFVVDGNQLRRSFNVSGIYKTGLEEYDRKFALVDLRVIGQLLAWEDNEVGGYEVLLKNIQDIDLITEYIYFDLLPDNLYAESIRRKYPNIFEWLDLQTINRDLIIALMAIVAVINMITALLILILERSSMIAILKSLGGTDWQIRRVFLFIASYIVGIGLLIGNVLGLGLAITQSVTGIFKLDETNYYLSEVPIHFDVFGIVILNVLTFVITVLFLLIPSFLVAKINPVKLLHFK